MLKKLSIFIKRAVVILFAPIWIPTAVVLAILFLTLIYLFGTVAAICETAYRYFRYGKAESKIAKELNL